MAVYCFLVSKTFFFQNRHLVQVLPAPVPPSHLMVKHGVRLFVSPLKTALKGKSTAQTPALE